MDIMMTSSVAASIQEVSPLFGTGAASGAAATADAASEATAGATAGAATVSVNAGARAASWAKFGADRPHSSASSTNEAMTFCISISLKGFRTGFTGADTDHLLKFLHEYLAVTDLAGLCRFFDHF